MVKHCRAVCMMMMPLNEAFYLGTLDNATDVNGFIQLGPSLRLPHKRRARCFNCFREISFNFRIGDSLHYTLNRYMEHITAQHQNKKKEHIERLLDRGEGTKLF